MANKKVAKKGMVTIQYLEDHGRNKKDDKRLEHSSVAKGLVAHKIVKIVK